MVDWQTNFFFFNLVAWQAKDSYQGSYKKLIQEMAQTQCSVDIGQPRILGLPSLSSQEPKDNLFLTPTPSCTGGQGWRDGRGPGERQGEAGTQGALHLCPALSSHQPSGSNLNRGRGQRAAGRGQGCPAEPQRGLCVGRSGYRHQWGGLKKPD